MLAVDDGISSGNLNAADVLFLIAAILALIAALLSIPRPQPSPPYATFLGWLALALVAFAWFVL